MELRKFIATSIREYLNEQQNSLVDVDSFPKDVLKTLKDEYSHFYSDTFDWNAKQDEFIINGEFDGKGFKEWLKTNETEGFIKNLDILIQKTRQDLILLIKQKNAEKALEKFEELIIPVLGDSVLCEALSKFMEFCLLNLHSTREIEAAYKESKNIIDSDGSLNLMKITPSKLFVADRISLPNFERFSLENPEYKGVFNDWKEMFDKSMELSSTPLNAFRDSMPYIEIKKLYEFLVHLKRKK